MNTDQMKNELFLLTVYLITSARGLFEEPAQYGSIRLIDSAGRLLAIMETQGMLDPFLSRLKDALDDERMGNKDSAGQIERLDQLVAEIVQEMQNRQ